MKEKNGFIEVRMYRIEAGIHRERSKEIEIGIDIYYMDL
tara:strand:- start:538 stop:654 length:117 start_codon:yes stop_codon:yes gene_type:complete